MNLDLVGGLRRIWAATSADDIGLLYLGTTVSAVVGIFSASALALALSGSVSTTALAVWLGLFVTVRLLRLALAAYHRRAHQRHALSQWKRWLLVSALVQALAWGLAPWLQLAPTDWLPELVLHVALLGVALGSVVHLASVFPVLVAYVLGIMLPLALRDLWIGGLHHSLAAFTLLMALYVLSSGYRQARLHADAQAQRTRNLQLIEALREQNDLGTAARAMAERAHAEKVSFFAAASHDLRQPLHALGLYAQLLRQQGTPAGVQMVSSRIVDCIAGMEQVVDELLELARLDAGRVPLRPETVSLAQLLREAVAVHQPVARAKGLRMQVELGNAAGCWVRTDPRLVRRVLANLLSNAVRYTEVGQVSTQATRDGENIVIEVLDTGIGIPADELPRIFEEFYRGGQPGREAHLGHGLGLATVKRLSDLLGLGVTADSTLGQGSRFSIRLPSAAAPTLTAPTPQAMTSGRTASVAGATPTQSDLLFGRRLLLIEDDLVAADAMGLLLREWGCQVCHMESTAEALAQVDRGYRPELVVADLRLAVGDDGCQAAIGLRNRLGAGLPVLLVSGDGDSTLLACAANAGLTVLRKPVRPVRLRACMNEALASACPAVTAEIPSNAAAAVAGAVA